MSLIISIDGNIGSGKTTFINELKKEVNKQKLKNIIFVDEPVELWTKICVNNENILEKFYQDQIKYAFSFQMMALISRIKVLKKAMKDHPDAIIISERSLYSDKNIFAQMLYDEGKIDPHSFQIYTMWFREYIKELPKHEFIYLFSDPKIVNDRIKKRNRTGENNIDIEYLINCNDYHENMFVDHKYLLAKIKMNHNIGSDNYKELISDTIKLLNNKMDKYKYIFKYDKRLLKIYLIGIIYILFIIILYLFIKL